GQDVRRDFEQVDKLLVLHQPLAAAVHDQHAIDGGVRLCFQKCRLGLQFSLRLFAPGDIAKNSIGIENSVFFACGRRTVVDPDPDPIFPADAVFLVKRALLLEESAIGLLHPAKILGVDAAQPEIGAAGTDFLLRVPEYGLRLRADVLRSAVSVRSPSYIRETRQDSAKLLLAPAQSVFVPLNPGGVLNRGHICGQARGLRKRMHPTFHWEASPIFAPKKFTRDMNRLMSGHCLANSTLLRWVLRSIRPAVMQQFVEILSDHFIG